MMADSGSARDSFSDVSTRAASPVGQPRQRKPVAQIKIVEAIKGAADEEPDVLLDEIASQDNKMRMIPPNKLDYFLWTTSPQPHAVRRRCILEKYPEVEGLYGNDPMQAISMLLTTAMQFLIAYWVSQASLSPMMYLFIAFAISGTLNHSLFAALHETSHQTVFEGKLPSELLSIIVTLPTGLPASIPFKRYHLDHHIYMSVTGMDPDLPTTFEAKFFQSMPLKLLWIFLLPITYSLRPMITRPKEVVRMDIVNWIATATVDLCVLYFWGWKSLGYLVLGCFFSMNFHPFAGHFISEHFIFPGSDAYQETNSYYGKWNAITYNVGYHNEHHDFPRVPGSRLPLVRSMAKEFYGMPEHHGWCRVIWKFILTPCMTPFNRVHRATIKGGPVPKDMAKFKLHEGDIPFGGENCFWPNVKT